MKKIFLAVIFHYCMNNIFAQHLILEQLFENGNSFPDGWEYKLDTPYATATNSSSPPAAKFSSSEHYLKTPTFEGATDVSFWVKGISTDTISRLIVEGMIDSVWATIAIICPIPKKGTECIFELPLKTKQLMFKYSKSLGNLAFDDLRISKPSRPPLILSCSAREIKDYSTSIDIELDTVGVVAYLVLVDTAKAPTISQMTDFSQYPNFDAIIDSGHVSANKKHTIISIGNLTPTTKYKIYLLTKGSKNNVDSDAKIAIVPITTKAQQPTLFFSAIVKGKGNNKIIAIYNPTSDTIDLSQYRIAMSTNGGGWLSTYFTFKKPTILLPLKQYIITKNTADSAFKAFCNPDTLTGNRVINFTGNDARAIQRTINNGRSWFTIDIYGVPTQSTDFNIAGIPAAAGKYNLYRKRYVQTGNVNWNKSAGTDSINSEWILTSLMDNSMLQKPFTKNRKKISFKNISFAISPSEIKIDTINQQIYVSLADTLDLKHINWSLDLDSNVIIFPYDQSLYDFSKDFS
ncbi:MAG: lamin tail domain-containing protein, partial [Bacteroidales bacterium]|nr:lamin tail domain-containing protein [Bacteroidales bacterium]